MPNHRLAIAAILAAVLSLGCARSTTTPAAEEPIKVGGLYAEAGEDGKWRVVKVLAVDQRAVHLRLYANTFDQQPTHLDPAQLSLGDASNRANIGIGHLPMAKSGFLDTHALIKVVPITDEELEGYRLYKEATKLPERKAESRPMF